MASSVRERERERERERGHGGMPPARLQRQATALCCQAQPQPLAPGLWSPPDSDPPTCMTQVAAKMLRANTAWAANTTPVPTATIAAKPHSRGMPRSARWPDSAEAQKTTTVPVMSMTCNGNLQSGGQATRACPAREHIQATNLQHDAPAHLRLTSRLHRSALATAMHGSPTPGSHLGGIGYDPRYPCMFPSHVGRPLIITWVMTGEIPWALN
jgi:hypothetical protein